MSTKDIREELTGLADFLIAKEMVLDFTGISDNGSDISWNGSSASPLIRDFGRFTNIGDYREWIVGRQYTLLLTDASLMQISYSFDGGEIVKHRLAYVPCPVLMDPESLLAFPVDEVLDETLHADIAAVTMASPVRFDFDLRAAHEHHPHSHLTINDTGCRIPCLAPLRLGHFVQFVFEHFYPSLWAEEPYLSEFDREGFGPATMSDAQAEGLHVSWRGQVPASLRA